MIFGLPELQKMWEQLPERLRAVSCIAGGAVRDALLNRKPDDIDVFVFAKLSDFVNNKYLRRLDDIPEIEFEKLQVGYGEAEDGVVFVEARWKEHTYQLIEASDFGGRKQCSTIESLIEQFDWNICQFAYDNHGLKCFQSPEVLWPGGSLRICGGAFNRRERAAERGREFAGRYGLTLPYEELRKLAADRRNERLNSEFEYACNKTKDFLEEVAAVI